MIHVLSTHQCYSFLKLKYVFQRNGSVVLENVDTNGHEIPGSQGRLVNPGHAIEAGWFLLNHAARRGDYSLKQTAIEKFIELPFSMGWDSENSGLYYFLDADGFSPTHLEWNMKLWWPHCEALIAFLMAYRETRNAKHFESFCKILDYTLNHVSGVCIKPGFHFNANVSVNGRLNKIFTEKILTLTQALA